MYIRKIKPSHMFNRIVLLLHAATLAGTEWKCVSLSRWNNWNSAKFSTGNPILSKTSRAAEGADAMLFSVIFFFITGPFEYIKKNPGNGFSVFLLVNFIRCASLFYRRVRVIRDEFTCKALARHIWLS